MPFQPMHLRTRAPLIVDTSADPAGCLTTAHPGLSGGDSFYMSVNKPVLGNQEKTLEGIERFSVMRRRLGSLTAASMLKRSAKQPSVVPYFAQRQRPSSGRAPTVTSAPAARVRSPMNAMRAGNRTVAAQVSVPRDSSYILQKR